MKSRVLTKKQWDLEMKKMDLKIQLISNELENLQGEFADAASEIDKKKLQEIVRSGNKMDKVKFIEELNKSVGSTNSKVYQLVQEIVEDSYRLGLAFSNLEMYKQGLTPRFSPSVFRKVDKTTINHIVNSTFNDIAARTTHMSDTFKRTVRDFAKEELLEGYKSGRSFKDSAERLSTRLREQGFDKFTDSRGRQTTIDQYSRMLIRTKGMEAHNTANLTNYTANGVKKFQISHHASSCKICKEYEGKIYTYEELLKLPNGGPPFHPNCRHVIKPVVELEFLNELDRAEMDELEAGYAEIRKKKREQNLLKQQEIRKQQEEAAKKRAEREQKKREKEEAEALKQQQQNTEE